MMNSFKAFSKQLLETRYERIYKSAFLCMVLYLSLSGMEIKAEIAPYILFLTSSLFTTGVMWQALGSVRNAESMMGVFMLPFENKPLVFAYVGALGIYTLITKTAPLLAILYAVGGWNIPQIAAALLLVCNACAIAAIGYSMSRQKRFSLILVWAVAIIAIVFFVHHIAVMLGAVVISIMFSLLCLLRTDAYTFYRPAWEKTGIRRSGIYGNTCAYLFRYLTAHKNYLANTAGLWAMACFLPFLLGQFEGLNMLPLGFAILTLNTPICILLSCDPDLEQVIRLLPGQGGRFGSWYCLFIFGFNLSAGVIFLLSWQIQNGGVDGWTVLTAVLFALQSAVLSVMLEWMRPLRNWKIESDLWHHPRKYCVPLIMVILAVLVGAFPALTFLLLVFLLMESAGLLFIMRRL